MSKEGAERGRVGGGGGDMAGMGKGRKGMGWTVGLE